jgi:hypothetical protein
MSFSYAQQPSSHGHCDLLYHDDCPTGNQLLLILIPLLGYKVALAIGILT